MLIKLTDPFGLSPFSGKNLAHGILNALGMIPGLGDIADLINAAWYLHDKDNKNVALSALSALPAVGEFAGFTFLAKAPKAAKYVKLTTKVIGHGSAFALAASGGISSAEQVSQAEQAFISMSGAAMEYDAENTRTRWGK